MGAGRGGRGDGGRVTSNGKPMCTGLGFYKTFQHSALSNRIKTSIFDTTWLYFKTEFSTILCILFALHSVNPLPPNPRPPFQVPEACVYFFFFFSASTSHSFRRTSHLSPVTCEYKRVNGRKATRSDREMRRKYNRITLHLARSPWGSHRRNPTNTRHTTGVISHSTNVGCIPNAFCTSMRSSLGLTLNRCRQKSVIATKPRIWVTAGRAGGRYWLQGTCKVCSGHKTKLAVQLYSGFYY